jgi:hypothetical protein
MRTPFPFLAIASLISLCTVAHAEMAAVAPPTLVSGAISGAKITIGSGVASPTIVFKYTAPGTLVAWQFTFTSPHGTSRIFSSATVQAPYAYFGFLPPAGTSGTLEFSDEAYPFSLYAEAGTWKLTSAALVDLAGNLSVYTGASLAKLFPSLALTVVNAGKQDFAPPVISSGKLLNLVVSLSSPLPYLGAFVTLSDNLSGAIQGGFVLTMPDGKPYYGYFPSAYDAIGVVAPGTYGLGPIIKGGFQFGDGIVPGSPTGKWTIAGYQVCDVAGNCVTDTNSADVLKLFGTTSFSVTK